MYINKFGDLNAPTQNLITINNYYNKNESILISRFLWDTKNDTIPYGFIEYGLINFGSVGIFKKHNSDELIAVYGADSGALDDYGRGTEYKGETFHGEHYSGKVGFDCIVIRNNSLLRSSRSDIDLLTYLQAETDKSIKSNLINCRKIKAFVADDDKTRVQLEKMYSDNKDGDLLTFTVHNRNFADVLDNKKQNFEEISITDGRDIDRLQYLSRFHDDIFSRFCMYSGIDIPNINKQAQITNDELNATETVTRLALEDLLHNREKAVEEINKVFNREWEVKQNITTELTENENESEVKPNVSEDENNTAV